MLTKKLEDPRLKGVTLTRLELTKDLKMARVYFSLIGEKHMVDEAARALEGARGVFKGAIGDNLDLRYIPELEFHFDRNPAHADRIDRIIKQINKESEGPEEEP